MKKSYQLFVSFGTIFTLLIGFIVFSWNTKSDTCSNGYDYLGAITEDLPVSMTLSCDLRTLKITESGNIEIQKIAAEDLPLIDDVHPDLVSYVDYSDDSDHSLGEVQVSSDYNFDGYNDLEIFYSYGVGETQVTNKSIFLYSSIKHVFEYHSQLSSLVNSYPDGTLKLIAANLRLGFGTYANNFYAWKGDTLQLVREETCSLVDPKGNEISDFENIDSDSRYRQTIKIFTNKNSLQTKIKYFPYKDDTYSCL